MLFLSFFSFFYYKNSRKGLKLKKSKCKLSKYNNENEKYKNMVEFWYERKSIKFVV